MITFSPYKGMYFYEVQIGKLVFQLRRNRKHWESNRLGFIPNPGRYKKVRVWIDPFGKWW